ncbi:accessory factor UbiK family protein [Hydromonas duriensis]|uniref:Ubiquinone biosynthesis accessory factor UbiK n=1 Tax=Hydromonas duriensis TaxID=1527608 RepID=A0A4V3DJM3_9BURK|nr:accessory factor UbiK family protein [Hydromonas duriensis]TDR30820.1 membrane fusogenic activity protein [Hydromonas duriensis]
MNNWQEQWKTNVEKTVEQLTKNTPFAEMGQNAKAFFTSALQKLDVVTREEFDIQVAMLARTREKLDALEKQVAALEQGLSNK